MSIQLSKDFFAPLDKFFATKTIGDVNRDAFLVCNLPDNTYKINTCLIFLRDWDSLETDSFNQVIIENKGAVFTFPCYWVSVPKELAYTYFTYIVQTFYDEYVSKWFNTNNNISSDNNMNGGFIGGGNSNCNCCPPCGLI